MKKLGFFLTWIVILSVLATAVVAQPGPGNGQIGQDPFEEQVLVAPVLGSALLDYGIYGVNGEVIGGVDGLLLDIVNHQIMYIVVDVDDLFGGDRLVPWSAFQLVHEDYAFGNGETIFETTIEEGGEDLAPNDQDDVFGTEDDDLLTDEEDTVTDDTGTSLSNTDADTMVVQDTTPFDPEAYILVLPVTEDEFDENAPVFDTGVFDDPIVTADQLDPDWDDETATFWSGHVDGFPTIGLADDFVITSLFFVGGGLFDGIDFEVNNLQGENLGELEEFVVRTNGSIPYAFIETDAFADIGDELVVISMPALYWNPDEEIFYLNVEEGELENAPRFDPDNDVDIFTNDNWDSDWNTFWTDAGFGVAEEETEQIPQTGEEDEGQITGRTVANLINERAYGSDGSVVGVVQSVMYGPEEEVVYVLLYDQQSDSYILVPWSQFDYGNNDRLEYTGDLGQLEDAPAYNRLSQIDVTSDNWDSEIAQHWGLEE